MTLPLLLLGLLLLTGGAEVLVRGAVGISYRIGMSPLVVGLTVVAFGTSFPEAAVSVGSALSGRGSLALGNAVGSNIFNVLFILGASAVVAPLTVQRQLVRLDLPVMLGSALLVVFLLADGNLSRLDGLVLFTLALVYTGLLVQLGRRPAARPHGGDSEPLVSAAPADTQTSQPLFFQLAFVTVGVVMLVVGARFLVDGASEIARELGASELVIGLTVVAAGTSLPEVATSLLAAYRGQRDIAVGNVVGSNSFNALFVLGAGGIAAPEAIAVPRGLLTFDLPVMVAVSLACLPIFFTGWSISRREGIVFLGYYAAYLAYLVAHVSDHPAEDIIQTGVLFYAAPLTAVTLALMVWRQWRGRTG